MIVRCPACGAEIKVYVKITLQEDVFDKNHAPLVFTTAKYNPLRSHWETAGHTKNDWKV
jgi:hypothetical protein